MHIIKRWIKTDGIPHAVERALLVILGIALILMQDHFTKAIHIIVGIAMLVLCGAMLYEALTEKAYRDGHDRKLPTAIVGLILGVLVLWHEQNSIPFIAIAWGISGLNSGITEFDHAICRIAHKKKSLYHLLHGVIELALALLLIFDPVEKIGEHILILGLEMLVLAFTTREEEDA